MWLDNLLEIMKEKNVSPKQLAERSNLPLKTISRILSRHTANPYIDTLDRIANALECSIADILVDTKTVIGNSNLLTLQDDLDSVIAERDLVLADNTILKDKVKTLTSEVELLKMQIMYKDKIIATHEYYNKLESN